ncbi:MAG: hypothetical protein NZ455_03025 [Bacteroidia bacterium]|nr:hypothetical protein [Bacteroidia bacterium]MDW8346982.1 hypothetical protein [Bacteroidia bacterium]
MESNLEKVRQLFVTQWGEMASNWGISKTMGQIYALLFSHPTYMDTDQIMQRLNISRGNANMNIRNLVEWGLLKKVTVENSRKEYFEAERDMFVVSTTIIKQRQIRELQPINQLLNEVLHKLRYNDNGEIRTLTPEEKEYEKKILEIVNFLELFNSVSMAMLPLLSKKKLEVINKIHKLISNIK